MNSASKYEQAVVRFLDEWFRERPDFYPSHRRLLESIRYSLLQPGGKRFRPMLAMVTAEAFQVPIERVLPFAAAVECIHTYSLIHDDLPAMDDDDLRRGQPTNHKKFEEATAILAGDSLLTEAFQLLADQYAGEAALGLKLVAELATASGWLGMVGGQAIDMGAKKESIDLDHLRTLHRLKTGALIRVSARGAAMICGADSARLEQITSYAENLGLAFQVADDLLDHDEQNPEPGSYPALLGAERTRAFLRELTETCLANLKSWPESAEPLRSIAKFNRDRQM